MTGYTPLNIENIRKRHNDADFLAERGRRKRERIKQIQEKYGKRTIEKPIEPIIVS